MFGQKLSKAGSIASMVCAIHCALTPIALLALPILAANIDGGLETTIGAFAAQTTDYLLFGLIAILAGFGLLATYPLHRDRRPVIRTALGLGIMLSAHLFLEEGSAGEIGLVVIGASLITWASFLNRQLCHCLGCEPKESGEGQEWVNTTSPAMQEPS